MQSVAAVMLLIAIRRRIGRLRAARPPPSKSSEGPRDGALPVRMLVIRRSATAAWLVNRCLRHRDLNVGADRDPEGIRLGHNEPAIPARRSSAFRYHAAYDRARD